MSQVGREVHGPAPRLEFALELKVTIGPTVEVGSGSFGLRRTVPILGGSFAGPRLAGRVLPGGADWQHVETNGLTFVNAHYVIETDDAIRIEVRNEGLRHGPPNLMERIAAGESVPPDSYYFRTTPRFYPPEGRYDWLKRAVFVGAGERFADLVVVKVWEVL
jgi:hypothetical protein